MVVLKDTSFTKSYSMVTVAHWLVANFISVFLV